MLKQLKTIICNAQAAQDNHLQCSSSSRQSSAMLKQLKTIICNAQAAQDNHLQCLSSSRQSSAMLKQLKTIICKALQMIVLSCLSLRDPCPSCCGFELWDATKEILLDLAEKGKKTGEFYANLLQQMRIAKLEKGMVNSLMEIFSSKTMHEFTIARFQWML